MDNHTIPATTFFTNSPEIRIRCTADHDNLVSETLEQDNNEPNKGGEINCFLRKASDQEQDGHIIRLEGVQRMDSFLRKMNGQTRELYHAQVSCFTSYL
jgi:hypothetical protein